MPKLDTPPQDFVNRGLELAAKLADPQRPPVCANCYFSWVHEAVRDEGRPHFLYLRQFHSEIWSSTNIAITSIESREQIREWRERVNQETADCTHRHRVEPGHLEQSDAFASLILMMYTVFSAALLGKQDDQRIVLEAREIFKPTRWPHSPDDLFRKDVKRVVRAHVIWSTEMVVYSSFNCIGHLLRVCREEIFDEVMASPNREDLLWVMAHYFNASVGPVPADDPAWPPASQRSKCTIPNVPWYTVQADGPSFAMGSVTGWTDAITIGLGAHANDMWKFIRGHEEILLKTGRAALASGTKFDDKATPLLEYYVASVSRYHDSQQNRITDSGLDVLRRVAAPGSRAAAFLTRYLEQHYDEPKSQSAIAHAILVAQQIDEQGSFEDFYSNQVYTAFTFTMKNHRCRRKGCGKTAIRARTSSDETASSAPHTFNAPRCSACYVRYCGRECQRLDWKRHKPLCLVLRKIMKEKQKDFAKTIFALDRDSRSALHAGLGMANEDGSSDVWLHMFHDGT